VSRPSYRSYARAVGRLPDDEHPLQPDAVAEGLEHGEERRVHDQEPVLGVVHDLREVGRVQPQIQRMDNPANRRDGVVRLEVSSAVPQQGRNPIPLA